MDIFWHITTGKIAFVDYLAIVKEKRQQGYGTNIMKKLMTKYNYMFYELEPDDNVVGSIQNLRQKFYKKIGAKK